MTTVERFWPFATGGLPEICSARGCYKDVRKPGPFCEKHARIHALRHLVGIQKPTQKRPRGMPIEEWQKRLPSKLFPTNLYAIRTDRHVKFGVSAKVRERLNELQTGAPEKLRLHGVVPAVIQVETSVHRYLKDEQAHGEWFHWAPRVIAVASLIRAKDLAGLLELMDDQALMQNISERIPQWKPTGECDLSSS